MAQTGAHLEGVFNQGTASVSASDSIVRNTDIEQAKDDAMTHVAGKSNLHPPYTKPLQFRRSIDGQSTR